MEAAALSLSTSAPRTPSAIKHTVAGWLVHALTMSGLVWACLASIALINGQIRLMWLWLGLAMVVDAVDGTLARKTRVSEVIPWFNGEVLDNIVDYLTWTFLPAVFMYLYLPFGSSALAAFAMLLAAISSVFCYANEGEKSRDAYFVGFPAAWNIAAAILYVLGTGPAVNLVATLVLAVLTLAPIHFTHPMRVKKWRAVNIVASVVWIGSVAAMIAMQARPAWVLAAFWVSGLWFILSGFLRTWRAKDDDVVA